MGTANDFFQKYFLFCMICGLSTIRSVRMVDSCKPCISVNVTIYHWIKVHFLTAFALIGNHNVLLLFASRNFHVAFGRVCFSISAADFFTLTFYNYHVLDLLDAVRGTNTDPGLAYTLTFAHWVKTASDIGTAAWNSDDNRVKKCLADKEEEYYWKAWILNNGDGWFLIE